MEIKNIFMGILAIAVVAVVFGIGATSGIAPASAKLHSIDVIGTAQLYVEPDIVEIYLTVISHSSTSAADAQSENAQKMNSVISSLEDMGIDKNNITSVNYRVSPKYTYVGGETKFDGYVAIHTIKVKYGNIDNAGKVVDVALNAGATRVDRVIFRLSKDKQMKLKENLLRLAGENARSKADAIAEGLGIKVVKVLDVSESYSEYYPDYLAYRGNSFEAARSSTDTSILSQNIQFSATVRVTFGFI
jgi:uncharacterized protein YggE